MIVLWAFHTSPALVFPAPASALLGCTEPVCIIAGLLNESVGRVHGKAKPRVSMLMALPHSNTDVRQLLFQLYLQDSEDQHQLRHHDNGWQLSPTAAAGKYSEQGVRGNLALPTRPI